MLYPKLIRTNFYPLNDAAGLLKEVILHKFDASVDVDIRLGVDPRKANQMVRGSVTLPHGTGKTLEYLCFVLLIRKRKQSSRS